MINKQNNKMTKEQLLKSIIKRFENKKYSELNKHDKMEKISENFAYEFLIQKEEDNDDLFYKHPVSGAVYLHPNFNGEFNNLFDWANENLNLTD